MAKRKPKQITGNPRTPDTSDGYAAFLDSQLAPAGEYLSFLDSQLGPAGGNNATARGRQIEPDRLATRGRTPTETA